MKKAAACFFVFILLAALGIGLTPQSASDLFQKALTKEKAEGNLEEAIALFQQVVDKGGDEALAAQAQLHIGICYEKLGLGKARESYQKVIDRYPRQAEAVRVARENLASLANAAPRIAGGIRDFTIRRVYDGTGPEWGNGLSSDGRYLAYTDWDTGDMAVVELATRQHRRFTDTGGLTKPSGEFGETSAFSPDDKQIAYGWQGRDRVCELRVVGFDGTNPRIVLRDANVAWFRPHDWAKDGKRILTQIMRKDKPIQIAMVSATDGTIRVIRELQAKGEDLGMALSADGGTIAYSVSPDPASSKRDVFLMKTDGSGHEALVSHPADDYLLGWAPDGRQVVFASDRTGSYGIWNVEVANGRALGTPQLIKGDLNKVDPVRLTPNGTLYYILFSNLTDVYTAPIDPETGKIIGGPAPVKVRYAGANAAPDWSRDGTRLAYRTKRGAESGPAVSALISVLDLKSGEEQQIAPRLDSIGNIDGPIWAPDGQSVLIIGNRGEERGIYKVEIPSGVTSPLVVFPPYQYTLFAVWSADAKSIFYPQGNPTHILRSDLETGRYAELAKMDGPAGIPRITLSPDGKWLAFTSLDVLKEPQRLMIVAAAGGPAREIYRTQTGEYLHWIQWTPDGRFLWFRRYVPPADAKTKPMITYWRVSADGQNLRQLELALPGGGDICIHPDGRQIAFTSGQGKIELWALENFLPPNKK